MEAMLGNLRPDTATVMCWQLVGTVDTSVWAALLEGSWA
jgi:hypothetical protein